MNHFGALFLPCAPTACFFRKINAPDFLENAKYIDAMKLYSAKIFIFKNNNSAVRY